MQVAERQWLDFKSNRDPSLREQLIHQYAPLVKYVIGRLSVSIPGVLTVEDLLSFGTIGLIQAVDRYDPTVGIKFQTYAIQRIRGSILDAVRSLHIRSRGGLRRSRELEHAYDELTQELGRMPEDTEVAERLGIELHDLHAVLLEASTSVISLDAPMATSNDDPADSGTLASQIGDGSTDLADQAERAEMNAALIRGIDALSERERLLLSLYYYEELACREIAEVLGVSASRVSQIHASAILKLRAHLRASELLPAGEPPEAASRGKNAKSRNLDREEEDS